MLNIDLLCPAEKEAASAKLQDKFTKAKAAVMKMKSELAQLKEEVSKLLCVTYIHILMFVCWFVSLFVCLLVFVCMP